MNTTSETRRAAYEAIQPEIPTRADTIYRVLETQGEMTAEEIVEYLLKTGVIAYFDYNFVRPRLTDLKDKGMVRTNGKRISRRSGKETAIWQAIKEEDREVVDNDDSQFRFFEEG